MMNKYDLFGLNMVWPLIVLSLILFILNIVDCLHTDKALANGGKEVNPFVRIFLMNDLVNPYRWAIKLAFMVGLLWVCWTYLPVAYLLGVLILYTVVMFFVVKHNIEVLERQSARNIS